MKIEIFQHSDIKKLQQELNEFDARDDIKVNFTQHSTTFNNGHVVCTVLVFYDQR